jgi:hypothetical protein
LGNTDRLERTLGALLEKLALDSSAADRRAAEVADVLRAASGADPDRPLVPSAEAQPGG